MFIKFNMNCEVCGNSMKLGYRTKIEGSVLLACKACAKYGQILATEHEKSKDLVILTKKLKDRDEITEEVIDDFNQRIRHARESLGWTQKKLANLLNEKESVIHRLEANKMVPSITLARKIEKLLNITLIVTEKPIEYQYQVGKEKPLTLGDIVKQKIKKNR
jgi:putative transcription factor